MKKILISGFIGSENLGDEAILKALLDNLELSKQHVTAISLNEQKTRAVGIQAVFAKKPLNIIRAIKGCDIFLIGGGGLLQDQTGIFNFLYYMFQLFIAKRYKKPVILAFVGVGPIKYRLSRFLFRRFASSIDLAVVRDEGSKRILLQYMREPQKIIAVHDAVLNFVFNEKDILPSPFSYDGPYAVVSLRRWFFAKSFLPVFVSRKLNRLSLFSKRYRKFVVDVASDLDEFLTRHTDMKLVFVSFYDSEDLEVLRDVEERMQHKKRVTFAKNALSEVEYLSIVRDSELLIGMRLHSLILASLVNKPFVALRYSTKVDEFIKQMNLSDYSIHVERYDSQKLQASIDAIIKDTPELKKKLATAVAQYRKDNEEAFEVLKQRVR